MLGFSQWPGGLGCVRWDHSRETQEPRVDGRPSWLWWAWLQWVRRQPLVPLQGFCMSEWEGLLWHTIPHTGCPLYFQKVHSHFLERHNFSFNFRLFFFLSGLDVHTWMPDVLQAGVLAGNVRDVILYTGFQLWPCFYSYFSFLPSTVFIFSVASFPWLLTNTPLPALHVIERF